MTNGARRSNSRQDAFRSNSLSRPEAKRLTRQISRISFCALSVALVMAAQPAWVSKPIPLWSEEDAKQILTDSPWAATVSAGVIPELNPEQRRQGGATGGGKGIGLSEGLEGINLLGAGRSRERARNSASGGREVVTLHWESALPVRAAELKTGVIAAPDLGSGDDYAIAVYDAPGLNADQKSLAGELKRLAVLKRDGKKDVKPSGVTVLALEGGLAVVVYLFPHSEEITAADGRVEFVAQIGRLSVAHYFYTEKMQLGGKLQL